MNQPLALSNIIDPIWTLWDIATWGSIVPNNYVLMHLKGTTEIMIRDVMKKLNFRLGAYDCF